MKPYVEILPKLDASQAEESRDFICPECSKSGIAYHELDKPKLVGYCDTEWGYMMIVECPHCFTKYRFHGAAVNKNELFSLEHAIRCYIISKYFSNSDELETLRSNT